MQSANGDVLPFVGNCRTDERHGGSELHSEARIWIGRTAGRGSRVGRSVSDAAARSPTDANRIRNSHTRPHYMTALHPDTARPRPAVQPVRHPGTADNRPIQNLVRDCGLFVCVSAEPVRCGGGKVLGWTVGLMSGHWTAS